MTRQIFWAGAAALALAACADSGAGNAEAAPSGDAAGNTQAGDPHNEGGGSNVLLDAEGIEPEGTEESMIPFGANSLDTIEQVTPVFGEIYDQDSSPECGAGPMEFAMWGPVWLMFQQGEFVGWELREASEDPWIGTPGGVTIGSPRADLETALGAPVTVEQTSLGIEFNGGGFTGLLSDETREATVTALWAGTSCAMR